MSRRFSSTSLPMDVWSHVATRGAVLTSFATLSACHRGLVRPVAASKIQRRWREIRATWDRDAMRVGDRVVMYGGDRRMFGRVSTRCSDPDSFCVLHYSPYVHLSYYYPLDHELPPCAAPLRIRKVDNEHA